jgi:hypothetical protein
MRLTWRQAFFFFTFVFMLIPTKKQGNKTKKIYKRGQPIRNSGHFHSDLNQAENIIRFIPLNDM